MYSYYLCHKPINVICSRVNDGAKSESRRITIYDLLSEKGYDPSLGLVGRLDVQTSGVILFTDDTKLMDCILRPPIADNYITKYKRKEYRLVLLGSPRHRLGAATEEDLSLVEAELSAPLFFRQNNVDRLTSGSTVKILRSYKVDRFANEYNPEMGWCLEAMVTIYEGKYHQVIALNYYIQYYLVLFNNAVCTINR